MKGIYIMTTLKYLKEEDYLSKRLNINFYNYFVKKFNLARKEDTKRIYHNILRSYLTMKLDKNKGVYRLINRRLKIIN